ncbi:MAG TPA: hypothetical protein VIN61_13880 [Gammaproteobacteria bacterium]
MQGACRSLRRRAARGAQPGKAAERAEIDQQARWLGRQIAEELGERIAIRAAGNGGYTLQVGFDDLAKLEETLERVRELVGRMRAAAGPRARHATKP